MEGAVADAGRRTAIGAEGRVSDTVVACTVRAEGGVSDGRVRSSGFSVDLALSLREARDTENNCSKENGFVHDVSPECVFLGSRQA